MNDFIRESWYAALWSQDLADEPVARTYLGQEIVLYRNTEGQPIALAGVCPHRFASLAKGKLQGDAIACPYHGLRFGPDGQCVHNPNGPVPGAVRIRPYPLAERHGMIWIWMGDGAHDLAQIPDVALMDDGQNYAWVQGTLKVSGNYQLVIDNLLDLTHVEFMHPFLNAAEPDGPLNYKARQDEERVWALYDRAETPTPPLAKAIWAEAPDTVRLWAHIRWDAPSNLYLESGFTHVGQNDHAGADDAGERLVVPTYHLLTPETRGSTHYFWSAGRNMLTDVEEVSLQVAQGIESTFLLEDEPMIADLQQRIGDCNMMDLNPLLLAIDNAAVRARRVIAKRLAAERALEKAQ
ncbi:aromatic ring-hydroxylating dioxygenase subunit alpha [Aquisediminimonas profunda]|uniref:aromatic ring-hydroxylating dioxygenase subunit alpha n=1 Tax=Aquisediminimonas profunda TaxID=1550733 RepID=UPI001C63159C|nr:aromatic ring-hydroxylating dioxygenase subunit alpha [Aquisediminimonas profunda]